MKRDKVKILPAILVENTEEYKRQIYDAKSYTEEVFVDIIDWERTDNRTIDTNQALSIEDNIDLNFDLMLDYPSRALELLLVDKRIKSIILNYNAKEDLKELIKKIKEKKIKVGISLNPENSIDEILQFLPDLDYVQIFTIEPGRQGQSFMPEMLNKAVDLRNNNFKGGIVIDGGVSNKTIPEIKKFPVDMLSVGSALSKAENPKKTYIELNNMVNK